MSPRLLAVAAFSTPGLCAAHAAAQNLELVWSDEFFGIELDTTKWEPMIGDGSAYGIPGWGNNEQQYYTDSGSNLRVLGGYLEITARRQNQGGLPYTSARLRSLNKGDFQYGRIEGRIQLPSAPGVWPAFWMLPTNSPYGGWPMSGEIDIMESKDFADSVAGTIHYGNPWPNNVFSGGTTTLNGTDFSAGYHVYAIEWEADQIRWYVDDVLYYTRTSSQWFTAASSELQAPFNNPFHLLLNVAVGGNYPDMDPVATAYPQRMLVDWVRVYQFVQAPFNGSAWAIPGRIEAEDFDEGTAGQAYFDNDASNNGGQYRTTGVDIESSSEGGFNVGWIENGEWLEYTVDVAQAGTYLLNARVAAATGGVSFVMEIDGEEVTPLVLFPATGGWQTWDTLTSVADLPAGEHVIRFSSRGSDYNLDWFEFSLVQQSCPADIDGDGDADPDDISAFVAAFTDAVPDNADVDGDGDEDPDDIGAFVTAFTNGC